MPAPFDQNPRLHQGRRLPARHRLSGRDSARRVQKLAGRGKNSGKGRYKRYRLFLEAVLQAGAQARLTAEIKPHDDEPLRWLQQGPGKETADSPGWSTPVKPAVNHTKQHNQLAPPPGDAKPLRGHPASLGPVPQSPQAVSEALAGVRKPKVI